MSQFRKFFRRYNTLIPCKSKWFMKISHGIILIVLVLHSISSLLAKSIEPPYSMTIDTLRYLVINDFKKQRSIVLDKGTEVIIVALSGKKYKGSIDSLKADTIFVKGTAITKYQIKKIKSAYATRKASVLKILLGITAGIGIVALLVGFVFSKDLGLSVSGSSFNDTTSFIIVPGVILGVLAFIIALDSAQTLYKSSKPGRYEMLLVPDEELQNSVRFYSE